MILMDFSSAFNMTIPHHLFGKLIILDRNTSLCIDTLNFILTARSQLGCEQHLQYHHTGLCAQTSAIHTADPQNVQLKHTLMFGDDKAVMGLINGNDEVVYREEVLQLMDWCRTNKSLNVNKTKEIVVDFRRACQDHYPLNINGSLIKIMQSIKSPGVHIAGNLMCNLKCIPYSHYVLQKD